MMGWSVIEANEFAANSNSEGARLGMSLGSGRVGEVISSSAPVPVTLAQSSRA